ncbi:DUF2777 family protein [Shouchella clausii]|uniref:DUF2777 domain-containing protein n=1 Tax=Shouchella clausii TaxID=79880 RepID=A0A268S000_SHOCL|nr:DUF2777 family protein [Shouchella clausii]PAD41846.1 hypothetical protein CHH54_15000 [Bacillus sp. 7520-S]SPU21342.1 Protein of uncharacterised function (DUF2777) [Niallia circulans]AST97731.1 hypothetical protein BC8716_17925 [Shouchella clausii]MBU8595075.1 DUF2777 domain-containing protein [Shouchella clausii]MCM3549446.1 DUF2777 domain-containing protein [Shouchella clausii]
MDRKEAQQLVGQLLIVDLGVDGVYLGELVNVVTEPKKPWRGEVRIFSVLSLPDSIFRDDTIALHEVPYDEGDIDLFRSQQLKKRPQQIQIEPYLDSVLTDLKRRYIRLKNDASAPSAELEALEVYIKTLTSQKRRTERTKGHNAGNDEAPFYNEYTFHFRDNHYVLIDSKGESLYLTPSHFEYVWHQQGKLVSGRYEGDGVFVRDNGVRYIPEENSVMLIDQKQFDPYYILRKELDPVALQGFEYNLQLHDVSHRDLIHCYNSLLEQLLNGENETSFQGVNFLTFQTDEHFVLVQHHFKRNLTLESGQPVYDRFEFTTDKGKRTISLYTNAFRF